LTFVEVVEGRLIKLDVELDGEKVREYSIVPQAFEVVSDAVKDRV
jgi:hypothetical protein